MSILSAMTPIITPIITNQSGGGDDVVPFGEGIFTLWAMGAGLAVFCRLFMMCYMVFEEDETYKWWEWPLNVIAAIAWPITALVFLGIAIHKSSGKK